MSSRRIHKTAERDRTKAQICTKIASGKNKGVVDILKTDENNENDDETVYEDFGESKFEGLASTVDATTIDMQQSSCVSATTVSAEPANVDAAITFVSVAASTTLPTFSTTFPDTGTTLEDIPIQIVENDAVFSSSSIQQHVNQTAEPNQGNIESNSIQIPSLNDFLLGKVADGQHENELCTSLVDDDMAMKLETRTVRIHQTSTRRIHQKTTKIFLRQHLK